MDRIRILVVDDEAGICSGIERILKDCRYRFEGADHDVCLDVGFASNGSEALSSIDSNPPDVLLLDYKLPDKHGIEIMHELKEKGKNPLTIMITAYTSLDVAISATKNGAFDFIPKPFTPDELKYSVEKAARHVFLQRRTKELEEEKKRVRFQFVSVLAHELKSPLNAVEGYLNILRDATESLDDARRRRMLERCVVRMHSMKGLIGDLLDMTCIESGERERSICRVDVKEVADEVVEMLKSESEEKDISIEVRTVGTHFADADREEVRIILNNLISNAIKFNKDGGSVDVELEGGVGEFVISVSDTGVGIANEDMPDLFKDFVRIRDQSTAGIPGSGLGLSTVKKIAELYGGEVAVRSKKGVGSTFSVRLPNTDTKLQ